MIEVQVEKLTEESFKEFGTVIGGQVNAPSSEDIYDFWPDLDVVSTLKEDATLSLFVVKKQRPFICSTLERHTDCSEAVIPIEGPSIAVFTLSDKNGDLPDIKSAKAFFLDGSRSINIKPGIWHWIPFTLSEKSSFIVILSKAATGGKDLEVLEFKDKNIEPLKLVL